MRALIVSPGPEFSVADVYRGWRDGLREAGVDVHEFNLHDIIAVLSKAQMERDGELRNLFDLDGAVEVTFNLLQARLYETWPDLVILVSGFFFDHQLIERIRQTRPHKWVMIHTESPYEDDRQVGLADAVDVNVLNDPMNIDRFREVNPRTIYIPHAHDPKVHHADGRSDRFDFGFCGTGYPSRIAEFEAVDWHGARVGLGGNWQALDDGSPLVPFLQHDRAVCMPNEETADLYRASNMSANLYRGGNVKEAQRPELVDGWAVGPREIELAACGTFFARQSRPEGDDLFPMLPIISGAAELGDVLQWSMTHPDERQAAADAARAAVQDRTFLANAERLLAEFA